MNKITTKDDNQESRPPCALCHDDIYSIANIAYQIGCEKPSLLHAVCFERLLENAGADK